MNIILNGAPKIYNNFLYEEDPNKQTGKSSGGEIKIKIEQRTCKLI